MSATRVIGLYSVIAAAATVLFAPLLSLAYFATGEGVQELEIATVAAWAEPARELAGGLLTWASPERVYATYLQAFAFLFPAVFLCARAVRARRPASCGRLERWSWRVVLVGYGLASVGLIAAFFAVLLDSAPDSDALNTVFLALMVPGMLISTLGSTVLGIALVRARYVPRVTAWLLVMVFPLAFVGSDVLGHNSLGMIPIFVAWAASGWRLWGGEVRANSVDDLAAAGEPHSSRR